MEFRFKDGFLMGVSSASTQIEGGEIENNWLDWYRKGHIHDNTSPAVADDHWNRWEEDTQLMIDMKLQISRFGIEWARIQPAEDRIDKAAIQRYRKELMMLRDHGIRPLLTIHHFSNPMWFEEKGAFLKRENLHYFLKFAELAVKCFGDLASDYITINEPNVYASNSYMWGEWNPGHKSFKEYATVLENFAYCHIKAYQMIHRVRSRMGYSDTKVGFANHLRVFDPKNEKNPAHRAAAKAAKWAFQGAITEAMTLGRFRLPLRDHWHIKEGLYTDFNGINYYSRSTIEGLHDGVREHSPINDLGWEIYPDGIVRVAADLMKVAQLPIWITENGTADTNDSFRPRYIAEHLKAISESDLPFERYYHWCFCDNWEWLEGQSARFGLVHVDYDTQKRTVKNSGRMFTEMIEAGGMTEEIWDRYVKDVEYNTND